MRLKELYKVAKKEIRRLKSEKNKEEFNDSLTALFFSLDSRGYVHLNPDGTPYITAEDGSKLAISELTEAYTSRVPQKTFIKMLEIGETYSANRSKLRYGNYETPFHEKTTDEIDCSSFAELVLFGIPFRTSKYCREANVPRYDFGIRWPENPYSRAFGPERYLANEIAHYAFDQGYAFVPRPDGTDLKPGDFLFFSTNKKNKGYFMDITHVTLFVEQREPNTVFVLHGNSIDVANYTTLYLKAAYKIDGKPNVYRNALVLAARFPVLLQA